MYSAFCRHPAALLGCDWSTTAAPGKDQEETSDGHQAQGEGTAQVQE